MGIFSEMGCTCVRDLQLHTPPTWWGSAPPGTMLPENLPLLYLSGDVLINMCPLQLLPGLRESGRVPTHILGDADDGVHRGCCTHQSLLHGIPHWLLRPLVARQGTSHPSTPGCATNVSTWLQTAVNVCVQIAFVQFLQRG